MHSPQLFASNQEIKVLQLLRLPNVDLKTKGHPTNLGQKLTKFNLQIKVVLQILYFCTPFFPSEKIAFGYSVVARLSADAYFAKTVIGKLWM